jgi:hypothetical protein
MKSIDIQAVLATAWFLIAIFLTVVLYPQLGGRGLLWLGIHHIFCLVGCTTEYFRYQRRQERRNKA